METSAPRTRATSRLPTFSPDKYPNTVKLAIVAILIEAVVGIGAGMVSAIKRYSFWDVLVTLVTSVLVAMPAFWLGMLLQLFSGVFMEERH